MKTLILLVLVGAVGYGGYLLLEHQRLAEYGISNEHPIGEFERLDAVLTGDLKLQKSSTSSLGKADIRPTAKMYEYSDMHDRYSRVILLLDRENHLQGAAGWSMIPTHSPVGLFMAGHWRRTGGPRSPQFEGFTLGRLNKSMTKFAKGQVKGTWEKAQDNGLPPGPTYEWIYLRIE